MPFDPTLPLDNSIVEADELRDQFNALKALIDAIPAGPPGPQGAPGEVTQAQLSNDLANTQNATLISSNQIKNMRLHMTRNVEGAKVSGAVADGFALNSKAALP